MLVFKKRVFAAVLRDLGYSGSSRADEVIAHFSNPDVALEIAKEAAGEESKSGQHGTYETVDFDIRIYQSRIEYEAEKGEEFVSSAMSKLTDAELLSLKTYILRDAKPKKKRHKCRA